MAVGRSQLALLLFVLGGCFDYDTEANGGASPAGPTPGGDVFVPGPAIADCVDAPPLKGPSHGPGGCAHEIQHPAGLLDLRPSCGDAVDRPQGLHLTFPTADPSRDVAVLWTTVDETRVSEVRLGSDPEQLDRLFRGHSASYLGLEGRVVHEVHLCGLEPGRTYSYQAGGPGGWSDVASFSTAPLAGGDFRFAVMGDTRSVDFALWAAAVKRAAADGVDVLLFSGDAVDLGLIQAQWDRWFSAPQPELASLPIIPANGNHDLINVQYLSQFALPRNEENFAYRYGDALIVSMTDAPLHDWNALYGRAKTYLEEALSEGADARWKILLNHRPFYSASTRHGQTRELLDEWLPIVDRHRVDVVFNGHDHNYERSRPLRGDTVVGTGEGTIYVIAAGLGAPLYDNGAQWWTATSEKVSTYGIGEVTPDRFSFTAYRLDGTVVDEFELTK